MVIRMFLVLWVDGLLPLAEAGQSVVGMVRDGQLFLQPSSDRVVLVP